MNTILVPIDFSDNSAQATKFAMDLADKLKARAVMMHANHPLPQTPEAGIFITEKELNALSSAARKQLRSWAEMHAGGGRNRVTTRLEEGWPAQAVTDVAREIDPLMIVMGRKGMNALERVLVGSVSMSVIKKSKWPVLLVPERWPARPLRRLAFATDYRKGDLRKTQFLIQVAQALDAELIVVHAHAGDKNAFDADLLSAYEESLLSRVRYDKLSFQIVSSSHGAEHAVHDFVKRNKVDLLAVARTKERFFHRLLLPGFTQQALRHADVPLLVFPNAGALMTYPELRISQRKRSAST